MKGVIVTFALIWASLFSVLVLNIKAGQGQSEVAGTDETKREAVTKKMLTSRYEEWKIFRCKKPEFEVKYPRGLTAVIEDSSKLTLSHALPLLHPDPCNFSDQSADLSTLTDFEIQIEVIGGGLRQAIIKGENSAAPSFLVGDTVINLDRYSVTVAKLKGYEIFYGIEGCGGFHYYFPLEGSYTLLVNRKLITELNPIIGDYRANRQLPGVIFPDEEEHLFKRIISTFRFLE